MNSMECKDQVHLMIQVHFIFWTVAESNRAKDPNKSVNSSSDKLISIGSLLESDFLKISCRD